MFKRLKHFKDWLIRILGIDAEKSITVLLGAGFSAPMGYPIGNQLNDLILNAKGDDFAFHTSGVIVVSKDGSKPDFGYKTSYDFEFDFCRALIEHFNSTKGYFDYEEFYDYVKYEAANDDTIKSKYNPVTYGTERSWEQMLGTVSNIFQQLVGRYLVDGNGESWYDNAGHMGGGIFTGYTGILNYFRHIGATHVVNIHTLNHDLFFERLNSSDWLEGKLCDGFEENGSPYYGELSVEGRSYMCRLQRYTGNYTNVFRLFKLHGSKDYGVFYKSVGVNGLTPDTYVKTRHGIGFGELFKERKKNGKLYYDRCWVNYHADFLTGTTSKITRYKEPLLFKLLFSHFNSNLKSAEKLNIIGYGGKDSEINKMLESSFDFKNKQAYIIDPYPSDKVKELRDRLGAKLIVKQLEDIVQADLD